MQDTFRLHRTPKEREELDNLADLYSIFLATEHLEKAYIRDIIHAEQYTPACSKLIAQYKTCMYSLGPGFNIQNFLEGYSVHCPAACHRLMDIGVPATTEHLTSSTADHKAMTKHVAETVQHFITLMDSLKLNMVAVDQIHPLLSDLMQSLNQVSLMGTFEGKAKIKEWLIALNRRKATDELDEAQVRQLLFDLENAHTSFYRCLSEK